MKTLSLQYTSIIGAAALGAVVALAPANSHAMDYSGKKLRLTVPTKEGGGTDRYSRIFKPYLEKYLPGNPTVLVVNKPGGSGIKGSNWFQRKAKRDGTDIISSGGSVFTSYVFGGKKVKFDLLKWNPVVMSPFGTCFYAHKETGVKGKDSVADIKTIRSAGQLRMGGKNPTSSELRAFLAYNLLGMHNISPVYGLSSGKRRKAVLRGELKMGMDSALKCLKVKKRYVKKGKVAMYMTMGFVKADGSIVRDPAMRNSLMLRNFMKKLTANRFRVRKRKPGAIS